MNVRRPTRVRDWLDGAKVVFTRRAGQETSEALEILIAGCMSVFAVQIHALVVHLPDFHERVANRLTARVQNPSAEVGDVTKSRRDAIIDDDEVVIGVERQVVGIERPFRLARRAHEFISEESGNGEKRGSETQAANEAPTILERNLWVHVCTS